MRVRNDAHVCMYYLIIFEIRIQCCAIATKLIKYFKISAHKQEETSVMKLA